MKTALFFSAISLFVLSLTAQERSISYSFKTKNNKVVQLQYDEVDSLFTYRFKSKGKIELEINDDLRDDDTIFSVDGYHRGGFRNLATDYNYLYFNNNGYDYEVYYIWMENEEYPEAENKPSFGVRVSKGGKELATIEGTQIIEGEVYGWSFHDILPKHKEDE